MKPRLFWTMLLAFILVIVLGVVGMATLFGLAVAGAWESGELNGGIGRSERVLAPLLADYYVMHGYSWDGVEQRLTDASFSGPAQSSDYVLLDADGRVVASNRHGLPVGSLLDRRALARGAPIEVGGERVGTLLIQSGPPAMPMPPDPPRQPTAIVWHIVRGFLAAGLGLVSVLLILAVFFARRLSQPLRRLTAAAQELAGGRLDVQVAGAPVRELDDLASAFNAMARTLSAADLQRRQMTADVAHELRTPLTIIKGRLEGMQDGIYAATPEQIGRLLDETALLERLIEDLRLLALAEAGQLPLYRDWIDPLILLEDTAAAFADQAAEQGVALRIEAPGNLPPLNADPQRLAQVLANLVANALRYTPSGGSVTLAARLIADQPPGPDPALLIEVRDSGQGIPADDLPRIFDRFWRADRSRSRGSGGTGLGLAIARQIVEAHGGTIAAASVEGQGTTISITLPLADEPAQLLPPPPIRLHVPQ